MIFNGKIYNVAGFNLGGQTNTTRIWLLMHLRHYCLRIWETYAGWNARNSVRITLD